MPNLLKQMQTDLYNGNMDAVEAATRKAIDDGMSPKEILDDGLIAGMDEVGRDFKAGDLFIPEVLLCARAMHAGLEILRPLLAESGVPTQGKLVIGTVAGDLHDIGKNLVSMMFQGAGFEVIDLGTDVSPEKFVETVRAENADLVGMSALLTTTMPSMKATIDAFIQAGLRDKVKVLIGGAPVTTEYSEAIGADGFAPDAGAAVDVARELLS
ncbi:MAG: corrinoid protein [Chloroflexota bacterium]|nr:corrinoid protein [Chloroflexota bacterium]